MFFFAKRMQNTITMQEYTDESNRMVVAATTSSSGGHSFSNHKPIMQNKPPPGRGGSSCVYADGKLVVFGGHYFEGGETFTYLNEVWLLDVNKLLWHKVVCTGEIPGPRFGHSCHLLGSRMFIFGGKGPKDIVYKDVYFLDLIEWVWVPVNSISGGPSARFFHASEVVGRKIVIHGGWDGVDVFNDFWIFNTDSFVWMQPRTTGFGPSPRYGHSFTLTVDGRLLIFGGCTISPETGIPKYNDDVRQLDTDTMVWSRPRVNGQTPTGRYGHSATLLSEGRILLFGGWGRGGCQSKDIIDNALASTVHILDTKSMTWFVPRKLGRKEVKHLYNHAACRSSANTVFLFGGFDGRQAIGDFYVINLEHEETY